MGITIVQILKPRITVRLYKILNIGAEYSIFFNDRYLRDFPSIHTVRTEQKFFILLYLEDSQRRGQFN